MDRSPRDRNSTFEPEIVPKRTRRLGQIDEMILSLYARGLSTRDIEAHLFEVYGAKASRELISNVIDVVTDDLIDLFTRQLVDFHLTAAGALLGQLANTRDEEWRCSGHATS